jgi:hypothetical protein
MSAGGHTKTGQVETQIAGIGDSKSVKSCEKIGCPSYCLNRKEISGANSPNEETEQREETEEKIESFAGTSCATCCRDESQVGCEASCRRE